MNTDIMSGINEDELGSLALEILDYVDRISDLFSKIDSEVAKLPSSYKGRASTEFIGMYNDFSQNYHVIKGNLKSYSDDLIELIRKTKENDRLVSNILDSKTEDNEAKLRSIN